MGFFILGFLVPGFFSPGIIPGYPVHISSQHLLLCGTCSVKQKQNQTKVCANFLRVISIAVVALAVDSIRLETTYLLFEFL